MFHRELEVDKSREPQTMTCREEKFQYEYYCVTHGQCNTANCKSSLTCVNIDLEIKMTSILRVTLAVPLMGLHGQ